jgi:hypothetical protein
MLQLFRLADRFDLQPVKRSRQGAQSRGFFQHHRLHAAQPTPRRAGASIAKGRAL